MDGKLPKRFENQEAQVQTLIRRLIEIERGGGERGGGEVQRNSTPPPLDEGEDEDGDPAWNPRAPPIVITHQHSKFCSKETKEHLLIRNRPER